MLTFQLQGSFLQGQVVCLSPNPAAAGIDPRARIARRDHYSVILHIYTFHIYRSIFFTHPRCYHELFWSFILCLTKRVLQQLYCRKFKSVIQFLSSFFFWIKKFKKSFKFYSWCLSAGIYYRNPVRDIVQYSPVVCTWSDVNLHTESSCRVFVIVGDIEKTKQDMEIWNPPAILLMPQFYMFLSEEAYQILSNSYCRL